MWMVAGETVSVRPGASPGPPHPDGVQAERGGRPYVDDRVPAPGGQGLPVAARVADESSLRESFPDAYFLERAVERGGIDIAKESGDPEVTGHLRRSQGGPGPHRRERPGPRVLRGSATARPPVGVIFSPEEAYENQHSWPGASRWRSGTTSSGGRCATPGALHDECVALGDQPAAAAGGRAHRGAAPVLRAGERSLPITLRSGRAAMTSCGEKTVWRGADSLEPCDREAKMVTVHVMQQFVACRGYRQHLHEVVGVYTPISRVTDNEGRHPDMRQCVTRGCRRDDRPEVAESQGARCPSPTESACVLIVGDVRVQSHERAGRPLGRIDRQVRVLQRCGEPVQPDILVVGRPAGM